MIQYIIILQKKKKILCLYKSGNTRENFRINWQGMKKQMKESMEIGNAKRYTEMRVQRKYWKIEDFLNQRYFSRKWILSRPLFSFHFTELRIWFFPQPEQNDPSIQPRKTFNLRFFEEAEAMEKLGQVFLRSKNPRFPVTVFLLPQVTPFIALPIYKRRQYRV